MVSLPPSSTVAKCCYITSFCLPPRNIVAYTKTCQVILQEMTVNNNTAKTHEIRQVFYRGWANGYSYSETY